MTATASDKYFLDKKIPDCRLGHYFFPSLLIETIVCSMSIGQNRTEI